MPRPGIRARLLKHLREHIDSRGWPVLGRRLVSVPPEISLDVAKRFFLEHLLVLKQINFSCWRWLSESTIFSHSSRRTYADECWTMIRDAGTAQSRRPGMSGPPPRTTEGPGKARVSRQVLERDQPDSEA